MGIVIATLGAIFGQVLHLPLREYLPFLTLGCIVWGFIASVLKESCSVFATSEGIIKQLSLSPFFYLLRLFWRNLVIFFHNLLIFPLVCVVVSCPIEIVSLLIIPGFIILCVNLFWLSIVISFLCARYRDCKQLVDAFVLILFYVSPVIWMPTALSPKSSVFILAPNPAYHLSELLMRFGLKSQFIF